MGQRYSFDLSYQFIDQDRVRVGSHGGTVGELPSPEDEVRTTSSMVTLLGQYQVADRLALKGSLPVVDRLHRHIVNEQGSPPELREWRYSGVGDLTLLGQLLAGGVRGAGKTSFTLELGAKLPTGRRHVDQVGGDEPEPPARPGTGSLDGLAGFHLMHTVEARTLRHTKTDAPLFLSALGRANGRGTERYRIGNELQATIGGAYPLAPGVQLLGQINSRFRGKDDVGDTDALPDNTGGTWVYATPGLRVQAGPALSLYGYVQLPVYQYVNRIQLVAPYHVLVGTTYAWSR